MAKVEKEIVRSRIIIKWEKNSPRVITPDIIEKFLLGLVKFTTRAEDQMIRTCQFELWNCASCLISEGLLPSTVIFLGEDDQEIKHINGIFLENSWLPIDLNLEWNRRRNEQL